MNIKKGDIVYIRTGEQSGQKGKVLHVNTKKNTLLVEGINMKKRHQRPTQKNPKGGVLTIEAPIHISNVALFSNTLGGPTKISSSFITEGDRKIKVRICRKTGEQI